eukprot:CAMPEP_0167761086 /NCGR_PEP_ID=MMETSP0110_2-20121227/11961_1 /TAXON_ID=629695 /ORGANISM="Gymnochlora sp., Strain CCMP2014" /LENGTH=554 /DNA_ID=CAMNT_0007647699 /DNA_START=385 /DNA_END=2049 /DNA_ORIENTATION=+
MGINGEDCGKLVNILLKDDSSLESLNLSCNQLRTEGCQLIMEALRFNTSLKSLELCGNEIMETGATFIARALSNNHTLRVLKLPWNRLKEKGFQSILSGLGKNNTLEELDLRWNGISAQGIKKLNRMLKGKNPCEIGLRDVKLGTIVNSEAYSDLHTLQNLLAKENPRDIEASKILGIDSKHDYKKRAHTPEKRRSITVGATAMPMDSSEVAAMSRELKVLRARLADEARKSAANKRSKNDVEVLEEKLRIREGEVKKFRDRMSALEKEKQAWFDESSDQQKDLVVYEEKYEELRQEHVRLKAQLAETRANVKMYKNELEESSKHLNFSNRFKDDYERIRQDNVSLNAKLSQTSKHIEQLAMRLRKVERERENAYDKARDLDAKLRKLEEERERGAKIALTRNASAPMPVHSKPAEGGYTKMLQDLKSKNRHLTRRMKYMQAVLSSKESSRPTTSHSRRSSSSRGSTGGNTFYPNNGRSRNDSNSRIARHISAFEFSNPRTNSHRIDRTITPEPGLTRRDRRVVVQRVRTPVHPVSTPRRPVDLKDARRVATRK